MRKALLLAVLLLVPVVPGSFAQKHAPTEEQCDADGRAWGEKTDVEGQNVDELKLRIEEMIVCKDTYRQGERMYFLAAIMSLGSIQDREENFINRHGLYGQFQDEDRHGKR
jgi:hypothetical protein